MSGSSLICHQPPPQSILCRLVMVIWRPKTSWFPPLDGCIWLILPPSSQLTSNMYVWHVPGDPVMFWSEADKFHFWLFVVYLYDLMFFCFSFYRFFFVSDCSSECLCESFFFLFRPGQSCRFQFLFWHHWAASLLFIMVFVLSLQNSLTVRTMCATRFESSVGNRCVNFGSQKKWKEVRLRCCNGTCVDNYIPEPHFVHPKDLDVCTLLLSAFMIPKREPRTLKPLWQKRWICSQQVCFFSKNAREFDARICILVDIYHHFPSITNTFHYYACALSDFKFLKAHHNF